MIIIFSCNRYSEELDMFGNYKQDILGMDEHEEWKYINYINKNNFAIAVLPHASSVLKEHFIEKALDKDGYIIEGWYHTLNDNGDTINYKVVNAIKHSSEDDE